jgi:hypothetical protein
VRVWGADRPVDLGGTLGPLRRGAGDPAHQTDPSGAFWWACRTPDGDGTVMLRAVRDEVTAQAWGAGADWLLDSVPRLLGEGDDWSALDLSGQPRLQDVLRRRPGLRLPCTGLVLDSLVPAVLEQRVTGGEARRAWRQLLHRFGTAAPGPREGLRVPPSAEVLLQIPSWDWHLLGVDGQRQRAVRAAATVAARLEECTSMSLAAALARLRVVPETVQRALGHPDAVSVGDYHLHDVVTHFFTGRARGDDAQMLQLLQPWAGQRQRVIRLVELSGVGKPRFGPRYAPVDIRAI